MPELISGKSSAQTAKTPECYNLYYSIIDWQTTVIFKLKESVDIFHRRPLMQLEIFVAHIGAYVSQNVLFLAFLL